MSKRGKGRRKLPRRDKKPPKAKKKRIDWRRSTATMLATTCVEVARQGATMLVRNSNDPHGPVLRFEVEDWNAFALRF